MRSRTLIVLSLAATATACGHPADTNAPAAATIAVTTEPARTGTTSARLESGGTVRAAFASVIASRVVATVVDVRVRAGDRIRRGEILIVLDGAQLESARVAADAAAGAAVESSRAASADEAAAAAALTLATAMHGRVARLREQNSATPGELDEAVAALRAAEARAAAARARRLESDAAIASNRAAAQAAKINASYASIAAPYDGVVAERHVDNGALAMPGAPLLTIEDTARFRLEVRLDASQAGFVRPGMAVDTTIDGVAAGSLRGSVSEVSQAVDPVAHTALVKVDLPADPALRSGLFGRVHFAGAPRPVLLVPATAIVHRGQLSMVFVVEQGTARMRMVDAGERDGDRVAILAGVKDGERVIVNPADTLLDGTPVTEKRQ